MNAMVNAADPRQSVPEHFDAVIIGAGVSGLYQLHRLRELGLVVRVFEAGTGVGGTWYWNRYPGARFDSESWSYGYSFSCELMNEWEWSERFAGQPETLRYFEHVADRFDLRRDIEFSSTVVSAEYDDRAHEWVVSLESGRQVRARFVISAMGALSVPTLPDLPGRDSYGGFARHTSRWPHQALDFTGKRVAVIGTGATGVQVIQEVAKTALHLTVLQRQPNWCAPLGNAPIDGETQAAIKASLPEILASCLETYGGFVHAADRRNTFDVEPQEREAFWERLYHEPGFAIWMANFRDVLIDERANAELSRFVANKIRQRVHDPVTAEKLIPRNHGFGTRRLPLETGYYEVYNQNNVDLVDLRETPIERIIPRGIRTSERDYEVDIIIYATGFDAVTGAFDRVDIQGMGGRRLKEAWADGPRTFLGLHVAGFPNLFTLGGPHNVVTFCNQPRCIELNVDWVTEVIAHMQAAGYTRVAPSEAAVEAWTTHVLDGASRLLLSKVDSWFMGINSNLPGKQTRRFLLYAGGVPTYRRKCAEVVANGYAGLVLE